MIYDIPYLGKGALTWIKDKNQIEIYVYLNECSASRTKNRTRRINGVAGKSSSGRS